jgi:hypothetical protein
MVINLWWVCIQYIETGSSNGTQKHFHKEVREIQRLLNESLYILPYIAILSCCNRRLSPYHPISMNSPNRQQHAQGQPRKYAKTPSHANAINHNLKHS